MTSRRRGPAAFDVVRPHRGVAAFELTVFAVFAALSAWVLALFLYQHAAHGRVWVGTDGLFLEDQLMYLGWIKDASRHVLASNLFILQATPHDYLQPAVAISGGLVALGIPPWIALLVWQPVALVALFCAVRAVVRRELTGNVARGAALVAGLFGGAIGMTMFPDLWLPAWSWGYPFALLGLACMLGALLLYSRGGPVWSAAALAVLATWFHPWEGELLALIVLGAESVMWLSGSRPRPARVLVFLIAIALPLAYYGALGHWDASWRLGQQASVGSFKLTTLALSFAPLAVPALLAYRLRPRTFLAAALRVWPPVALVVFLLAEHRLGNSPLHAMLGISVPLAVLAVEGLASLRVPTRVPRAALVLGGVAAALAVTVPVTVAETRDAAKFVQRSERRNPLSDSEWRAISYLAHDPQPGGVLTEWRLGTLVPGKTGRHVYLGNLFWSQPNPRLRSALAWRLLNGDMRPQATRSFVLASGARFVLSGCHEHQIYLSRVLRPIISSERRFGCAVVFQLA